MPALAVSTDVYVPPAEVFAFLLDFPGYAAYSSHLRAVRQYGDGGVGTEYELDIAWWRVEHTARTAVTDIQPNERIEWEVVDGVDAHGAWVLEERANGATATRVTLVISYRTGGGVESLPIDLPRFVPTQAVIKRAKPVVRREAEATVKRIVADLEGAPREVDLDIDTDPTHLDQ